MKKKLLLVLILSSGCATSFTGSAHVDRAYCISQCKDWNMNLIGMVAMGKYSDACICKEFSNETTQVDSDNDILLGSASTTSGAVGVNMQMNLRPQQAGHHHHHH